MPGSTRPSPPPLFCVLAGAIGGGVWWTVTVVGLVIIAAWFVVDRKARQRRPDGRSHTTGLTS